MICYEAFKSISGQHNFPSDFPSFEVARDLFSSLLSRPDVYSVIAESEGRIVGSNFHLGKCCHCGCWSVNDFAGRTKQ